MNLLFGSIFIWEVGHHMSLPDLRVGGIPASATDCSAEEAWAHPGAEAAHLPSNPHLFGIVELGH